MFRHWFAVLEESTQSQTEVNSLTSLQSFLQWGGARPHEDVIQAPGLDKTIRVRSFSYPELCQKFWPKSISTEQAKEIFYANALQGPRRDALLVSGGGSNLLSVPVQFLPMHTPTFLQLVAYKACGPEPTDSIHKNKQIQWWMLTLWLHTDNTERNWSLGTDTPLGH